MDFIFKKFKAALCGLKNAFFDKSILTQIVIACGVVCFGIVYSFNVQEWMWIISCIMLVIICETLNTAIERICDLIDESYNEKIKFIKDLGAGAVLMSALYALFVGVMILKGVWR